jgi:hypothetical protein
MCRNWKFITAENNLFKKKQTFFAIGPVAFAPGTQTYATELTEWTIGYFKIDFFHKQRA